MLPNTPGISASLEDYLEAIHVTVEAKGAARAKDIVNHMGVHNSSVTQALRSLSDKKLINYAPYDVITLTDSGRRIAVDVLKRHETLHDFLVKVLGLPEDRADEAACRMEHTIGPVILDRLVRFVEYFENCQTNDVRWDDEFGFVCRGERGADHTEQVGDGRNAHGCQREKCSNFYENAGPRAAELASHPDDTTKAGG